jgi:hypothetical protein
MTFGEDSCGHLYMGDYLGEVDVLVDDDFTPCTDSPPPDRTPPALKLARKPKQALGPHRSLHAVVRCSERCAVTVRVLLHLPGEAHPREASRVGRSLEAGERERLRLLLSHDDAEAARSVLRAGGHVRATISAVARDKGGNTSHAAKSVRVVLKRRRTEPAR